MRRAAMSLMVMAIALAGESPSDARDTKHLLPINAAMETKDAQEKLEGSVKFYFGSQLHPQVVKRLGTDVANRKTNSFNKSDEKACNWAFLSALVALEKRAQQLGANAVVNVVSYYRRSEMASSTQFECHAGAFVAGVALRGEFVTVAE